MTHNISVRPALPTRSRGALTLTVELPLTLCSSCLSRHSHLRTRQDKKQSSSQTRGLAQLARLRPQSRPQILLSLQSLSQQQSRQQSWQQSWQQQQRQQSWQQQQRQQRWRKQRTVSFSVLSRPPPNYEGHVPLTRVEKGVLAVGSAVTALLDPRRHDMVALLSETSTPASFLKHLRNTMLRHPTGRRILRTRPRITSTTLSPTYLSSLPANSFGATYAAWLRRERVTPDTRLPVRHIDDEECAYVLQRYRETHDFLHALTGLPVFVEGETAVKVLEYLGLGGRVPMAGVSVVGGLVRMGVGGVGSRVSRVRRGVVGKSGSGSGSGKVGSDPWGGLRRFWGIYGPWAVRSGLRMGGGRLRVREKTDGGMVGGSGGVEEEEEKKKKGKGNGEGDGDGVLRKGKNDVAATAMGNFLCVYWEEWMDKDIDLLRRHLGIHVPPDMRDMRKRDREERARHEVNR